MSLLRRVEGANRPVLDVRGYVGTYLFVYLTSMLLLAIQHSIWGYLVRAWDRKEVDSMLAWL